MLVHLTTNIHKHFLQESITLIFVTQVGVIELKERWGKLSGRKDGTEEVIVSLLGCIGTGIPFILLMDLSL